MNTQETPSAQQMIMSAASWAIGVVLGLPLLICEISGLTFSQLVDLIGSQMYSLIPLVPLWFSTLDPVRSILLALPTIAMAAALPLINIFYVDAISHGVEVVLILVSLLATYLLYRKFE